MAISSEKVKEYPIIRTARPKGFIVAFFLYCENPNPKRLVCDCGNDIFWKIERIGHLSFLAQCTSCKSIYPLANDSWTLVS